MNPPCPHCQNLTLNKDGHYFRSNDSRMIQRFVCKNCQKKSSTATQELECYQKKRRINHMLFKLLCSGNSMRRSALILGISKNTVTRRLPYLAEKHRQEHRKFLEGKVFDQVQLDDLITLEHSKLKPLSVSTIVEKNTRTILGLQVSSIPAFGHLAKLSRRKYGKRKNQHKEALVRLFEQAKSILTPSCLIESDKHPFYPKVIKDFLPASTHKRYKGGRGCVTGQGELKKQNFDPLFSINHTYAMLRANVNRLIRRTWSTTKDPDRLKDHLDLYVSFHNRVLLG